MTEKKCTKCSEIKLLTEFYKDKQLKDGHTNHCKVCRRAAANNYRINNLEKIAEYKKQYAQDNRDLLREKDREKYQRNREDILEKRRKYAQENSERISEYHKEWYKNNQDWVREYLELTREHRSEYKQQWYEENVEYAREYAKAYYRENPERIAEYRKINEDRIRENRREYLRNNPEKNRASAAKRNAIKKSTSTTDSWELAEITLFYADCPNGYHVDHIIPLALGGRHELSNLQHLEDWMNLKKAAKHPDEWDDPRPISCRA